MSPRSSMPLCHLVYALVLMTSAAGAQEPSWSGIWLGTVVPRGGPPVALRLRVGAGDDVAVTFAPHLAASGRAFEVRRVGSTLAFSVRGRRGALRLIGTVDPGGRAARGILARDGAPAGTFALERSADPAQLEGYQRFDGWLRAPGARPRWVAIDLAPVPGGGWVGGYDDLSVNDLGRPLLALTAGPTETGGCALEATLPGRSPAHLSLHLAGNQLRGTLRDRHGRRPLELTARPNGAARAQDPRGPRSYTSREIEVHHPAGHVLAGTLTVPDAARFGPGPYPAVLLISGSGQQDRDGSIAGHRPLRLLADRLTRQGVAVLRYDDRGTGRSSGAATLDHATVADFATDAAILWQRLRRDPQIDPERCGLCGHSEGGIIAVLLAATEQAAFTVLLATPVVPGTDAAARQLARKALAAGATPADAARLDALAHRAFDEAVAHDPPAEVTAALRATARAQLLAHREPTTPARIAVRTADLQRQLAPTRAGALLAYDPRHALRQISGPLLLVVGDRDVCVDAEQNLAGLAALAKADGKPDWTGVRLPGLNHLLQPCRTGAVTEYGAIETTIAEPALATITSWVLRHAGEHKRTPP